MVPRTDTFVVGPYSRGNATYREFLSNMQSSICRYKQVQQSNRSLRFISCLINGCIRDLVRFRAHTRTPLLQDVNWRVTVVVVPSAYCSRYDCIPR